MVQIIQKNLFATVWFVFVVHLFCCSPVHADDELMLTIVGIPNAITTKINISMTSPVHNLRSQLEHMGHIEREDKFSIEQKSSNGDSYFSLIENENDIKVSDIIFHSDNRTVLHVSRPIINLADRFLLGMRYINPKWQLCMEQVAFFATNYKPEVRIPATEVHFESNSTLSRTKHERAIEGIDQVYLSIGSPFVSGNFENSQSNHNQSIQTTETVYSYARLLRSQREIKINAMKLKASGAFVEEIRNIARDNTLPSLERAKNLVRTLNKYGWYMPVHYIVGGAYRECEFTQKDDRTDLAEHAKLLQIGLEASYGAVTASIGGKTTTTISNSLRNETQTHKVEKSSVGANGAISIETFLDNVNDEKNWKIIKYIELYPTLLLLERSNNWSFTECIYLLRDHCYLDSIKQLQQQIDMEKYWQNLSGVLSPTGF